MRHDRTTQPAGLGGHSLLSSGPHLTCFYFGKLGHLHLTGGTTGETQVLVAYIVSHQEEEVGSFVHVFCSKNLTPSPAPLSDGASVKAVAAAPLMRPLTVSAPAGPSEPLERALPAPGLFSREFGEAQGFLTQCTLVFKPLHKTYATEFSKITYIYDYLNEGKSIAVINSGSELTYAEFIHEFKCVFLRGVSADATAHRMFKLCPGKRRVTDYAIDFWILAEETGREEKALQGAFLNGFAEYCQGWSEEGAITHLPPL